jgi:tetratricopeptide (TPR) repeat protein
MDLLLAKIMYDIKTKQNFGKSDGSLVKLIKAKYGKISKEKKLVNSPIFRMRLFKMYSRLLLQERDYMSLEKFLIESYNEFENSKLFNRSNHNDKLSLLTYLTNCLYKTKKHKKSLKYAEQLLISMKEYDCFLHDKYLFYYYNMLVLNYAKTDKKKALDYLNKASRSEVIKKMPSYSSFIYLNRALIYFYQNNFSSAQKNMSRLIIQEDFLLLDKALQLKILIADLMIRLVPSQNTIIEKILSINENYKELLEEDYHIREKEMIDIISKKVHNEDIVEDKKKLLDYMSDSDSEDIDIISYNSWMKEHI